MREYFNIPASPSKCRRVSTGPETETGFGRLGGTPPQGVHPPISTPGTKYFASFALLRNSAQAVSLFLHFDHESMSSVRGVVARHESLISAVLHANAPRASASEYASNLSYQALVAEAEEEDDVVPDPDVDPDDEEIEPEPLGASKLGGAPYLMRQKAKTLDSLAAAESDGFVHVLQLDFQSCDVSGDWPFGDGLVSVFGRFREGNYEFRFLWDY